MSSFLVEDRSVVARLHNGSITEFRKQKVSSRLAHRALEALGKLGPLVR